MFSIPRITSVNVQNTEQSDKTCVTRPPLAWQMAELMRSHWLKSSDGQMFEGLCATRTRPMSRSVEALKA